MWYLENGKELQEQLWYILYAHLAIWALLLLFVGTFDGIFEWFAPLILWWGISQKAYCNLLIYLIVNSIGIVTRSITIITLWANFGISESFSSAPMLNITILLLIAFYITSVIFTYMGYKEFKAWAEPYNGGYGGDNESQQQLVPLVGNQRQANNVRNVNASAPSVPSRAFHGQGVRLGGD